jgi:hypothetical protein
MSRDDGQASTGRNTAYAFKGFATNGIQPVSVWTFVGRLTPVTCLRESVSTIEKYGTGDSVQFTVSTDGGHLSDVSVHQLSQDMTSYAYSAC